MRDKMPMFAEALAAVGTLGETLIAQERARQAQRYTATHDDTHKGGELARAAASYLWHSLTTQKTGRQCASPPPGWPWSQLEFRPANELQTLVKAGALIAAEIDRLARTNPELLK